MKWAPSSARIWTLVVVTLLALLPLVAVLQYRWIGEVSQAERERMQANLRNATTQFSQEFNHELTRASLFFQMDPFTLAERDWEKYGSRYEQWTRTAPYPNLVRRLFYVEVAKQNDLQLLQLNAQSGRLEPADWPPEYEELKTRLDGLALGNLRESRPGPRPYGWSIVEEIPALLLPVFQPFPRRGPSPNVLSPSPDPSPPPRPLMTGCSIVELNLDFLQNHFLPDLAHKHFADRNGFAYQVAVVSRSDRSRIIYESVPKIAADVLASPDAAMNILALRPQDFFRFTGAEIPGRNRLNQQFFGPGAEPGPEAARNWRPFIEGMPGRRGPGFGAILAGSDTGQWQLAVKHRSGSLETAVAQARQRNLGISFGILVLLSGSVAMLVVSTRRAQRLARLQMEFVAGVSHELRTPLAVICSAADNLADGIVASGQHMQKYGSLIRGEGRRLSEMIDQILGFATTQSNHKKYDLRPVDVTGLIESALGSSSTFHEPGVEISKQIAPDLPAVMADPGPLTNCIQNLLNNAFKYAKESGWIGIRAETGESDRGPEVRISVEDRGPGIDPEDLPHIFEPFYRGAKVVAAQIHGTGLGLSLVKNIVEAQGGAVTVKSAPGEGAVFTVHLPVAR